MRAVIISDKRTGSTFLQEALDSHPDLKSFDELFMVSTDEVERRGNKLYKTKKQMGYDIPKYLDWIADKGKNTVFRLIYNQNDKWDVLPHIINKKMKIIHLKRDPIDIVLSVFCKTSEPDSKIKINKNEFKIALDHHRMLMDKYNKKLSKYNNVLEIQYDDLFGKVEGERTNINAVFNFNVRSDMVTYVKEDTNSKICKFLEIRNKPMYSNITKIYTLPKEKRIINWSEIKGL